ncbi:MAG: PHP domain-containing protein, partial [Pseudomonadota bacterium]
MATRDEMTAALREEPQPAPARPFVHLHTHSAYSLLEGAVPLAKLMGLATTDGQPALAITDRSNLFGALEFSSKAAKEGLQPIIGCTLEIDFDDQSEGSRSGGTQQAMVAFPTLVLLASNEDGYQNLIRLVSLAYLEGAVESRAHITLAQLIEHNDGLIVLTGGPDGPIDGMIADDHPAEALARLQSLQKAFGDRLYIELQRQAGYSP